MRVFYWVLVCHLLYTGKIDMAEARAEPNTVTLASTRGAMTLGLDLFPAPPKVEMYGLSQYRCLVVSAMCGVHHYRGSTFWHFLSLYRLLPSAA